MGKCYSRKLSKKVVNSEVENNSTGSKDENSGKVEISDESIAKKTCQRKNDFQVENEKNFSSSKKTKAVRITETATSEVESNSKTTSSKENSDDLSKDKAQVIY